MNKKLKGEGKGGEGRGQGERRGGGEGERKGGGREGRGEGERRGGKEKKSEDASLVCLPNLFFIHLSVNKQEPPVVPRTNVAQQSMYLEKMWYKIECATKCATKCATSSRSC